MSTILQYKVGFLQQERLVNVVWGTTVYVFKPTVQSRLVTRRTSSYITSDYYLVSLVLYLKTVS